MKFHICGVYADCVHFGVDDPPKRSGRWWMKSGWTLETERIGSPFAVGIRGCGSLKTLNVESKMGSEVGGKGNSALCTCHRLNDYHLLGIVFLCLHLPVPISYLASVCQSSFTDLILSHTQFLLLLTSGGFNLKYPTI
jgi:hypothetical protein